jgi:hypothetical protein
MPQLIQKIFKLNLFKKTKLMLPAINSLKVQISRFKVKKWKRHSLVMLTQRKLEWLY